MEDIQLDYEMKPETLKKLNEILAKGKVELSRGRTKHSTSCYILTQDKFGSRGMTICSAVEKLHDTMFPAQPEEITVDGIVYVKKI